MALNVLKNVFVLATICCFVSESRAASISTENPAEEKSEVCSSPSCHEAAEKISQKIDFAVDPCDDFYGFACGQYVNKTEISEDQVIVDTFSVIRDILQDQLKTLITSPIEESDIEPFKMVKKLYSACMNKELIEQRGLKVILDVLDRFGGWPAVKGDSWDEESWTWQKGVLDCRKNGYSDDNFIDFSVGTDLKNSSAKKLEIDQPNLGLVQVILLKGLDNPVVKAYHSFQVDMAVLYGADRERAEKDMKEAFEFETALANISLRMEERRNATALYNPFTIKELQEKFPYNNWLKIFNELLPEVSQVTEDEIVIVYDVPFFEKLDELLKVTSKRAIANYMMWRVAADSTNYLTDKLRKRQLEYATAIIGQQSEEPRWKECTDLTTSHFEIALSALYVRKYFDQSSKAVALDMVNNIRDEFEEILAKISWMDTITKAKAIAKAKAIIAHIGYPDELMDDNKLTEYYKKITVDEDKLLESILSIQILETDLQYEKLREVVNKTDWRTHSKAAVVNAAYSPKENSIRFPAGILQDQFFAADRPNYMNYGAIGQVIGHEITHGFDDQGRQFDLNGNLVDWWGKSTAESYLSKAKCIIDQYSNFTDPQTELNLNGINTQGENIADNGGLKEAYFAYNKYAKAHPEGTLPGLNYNVKQLFWISSAQTWCAVFRPEELKKRILTGVHSPNQFRVLGPLHNMKEFSEDFQCPEGSKMNPVEKCAVW